MLNNEVLGAFNAKLIWLIVLVVLLQQYLAQSKKNHTSVPQDHFLQSIRTAVKQNIKIGKSAKCHFHPIHAREQLFDHKWDGLISDVNKDKNMTKPITILIYSPCMSTYNLGNTLGNYLNEIACAIASKISLVIGTEIWDYPDLPLEYKGPHTNAARKGQDVNVAVHSKTKNEKYFHFFRALPVLFNWYKFDIDKTGNSNTDSTATYSASNVSGTSRATADALAINRVTKHCPCPQYCWSDETAPMWKHISVIKNIIKVALDEHMEANKPQNRTGTIINAYDLTSVSSDTMLPIVPDAAVHYRCGDTVPSTVYGFLPFQAVRDLIPSNSRHIYVLTDPPGRDSILNGPKPFSNNCKPLLASLFSYLKKSFPSAIVIVKFGGNPFEDFYRLANAKVTVCSASTFCFWPALITTGVAHFPVTSLIAGGDPLKNNSFDLGPNFKWLHKPRIVTEFKVGVLSEEISRYLCQKSTAFPGMTDIGHTANFGPLHSKPRNNCK